MATMATRSDLKDAIGSFEGDAGTVLSRLRLALSNVLAELPMEIRRMSDLQKCLGLDKRLSWQVFRFVTSSSSISAASQLPGTGAMLRFLDIAAEKGVSQDAIGDARSGLNDLDRLIAAHAGDRNTFDAMLCGLAGDDGEPVDLATRRQAFRANTRIWGVQTKVQLVLAAYNPNEEAPDEIDFLGVRGMFDFRRIRHQTPFVFATIKAADDDGAIRRPSQSRPLDPNGLTAEGVDLIREFSSNPLPKFCKSSDANGRTNIEIIGNGVGNESAVTCVRGSCHSRAFSRLRDEHNHVQRTRTAVRTPCELLLLDVLVRKGAFGSIKPTAMVYSDHRGGDTNPVGRECDLLPLGESVKHLGRGVAALLTPDLPRYTDLVTYAFREIGWDPEQFEAYRCRVEYPVMPSSVVVQFELPERP